MSDNEDTIQVFLEYVWRALLNTGDWPFARKLEVDLAELLDPQGGLGAVCEVVGRDYVICEDLVSTEARVKLRIRGVARCARSGPDIDAFFTLLRFAGDEYTRDPAANISLQSFTNATGIEPALATRAFKYAMMDGGRFWRSGSEQLLVLDRFARFLREVRSFDELEEQMAKFDAMNRSGLSAGDAKRLAEKFAQTSGGAGSVDAAPAGQTVFVVHGRDSQVRDSMFSFLRALGLNPLEWSEAVRLTKKGSPYIGEVLELAFSHAQAVVVLLTPDDEVRLSPSLVIGTDDESERHVKLQPRPNVLFEAGMAFGYQHDRTILVEVGSPKQFSDVHGRHAVRLDNSGRRRRELADRLLTAGCRTDTSGDDWLRTGSFEIERALPAPALLSASRDTQPASPTPYDTTRTAVLTISSCVGQIAPDRHDYVLEVHAVNTCRAVLNDWTVQVQIPLAIVSPTEAGTYRVETHRDPQVATYRVTQEQLNGKPLFPDDRVRVFNYQFAMDDALYDRGQSLLGIPVNAVLFVGDEIVADATIPFGELQHY